MNRIKIIEEKGKIIAILKRDKYNPERKKDKLNENGGK